MADEDKASKTEQPTAKKLRQAHERGQFPKSPDIATTAVLIAAFLAVAMSWKDSARDIGAMGAGILGHLGEFEFTAENATQGAYEGAVFMAGVLSPIFFACIAATILAGGFQSKFRLTMKVFESGFGKLNPVKGFKRIFSASQFVQGGMDFLKFIAVAAILYGAVQEIMDDPIFFTPVPFGHLTDFLFKASTLMILRLIVALGIIALLHFLYQKHKHTKDNMMTKQEVKDENKQAEGDAKTKAAMRAMGYRMLQNQMLQNVGTADVVVTNPTHFAVALKYERGQDQAPVVVAKGEGAFARRIKAIAAENGVPMVENKPVARLLFKVGVVGECIPYELYEVVAKILAHVYKANRYYYHRLKSRRAALAGGLAE